MKKLNIKKEINFDLICRTCLEVKNDNFNVFDLDQETQIPYIEMLLTFTKVEILKDDKFPQQICNICKNSIINAFKFKNQCEQNEVFLKNYLADNKNNELEIINDNQKEILDLHYVVPPVDILIKEEVSESMKTQINIIQESIKCDNKIENMQNTDISEILQNIETTSKFFKTNMEQNRSNISSNQIENNQQDFLNGFKSTEKPLQKNKSEKNKDLPIIQNFVCEVCHKTFIKPYLLKKHMVKHDPDNKKFECSVCNKKFTQKDNMKTHIKKYHDKTNPPKKIKIYKQLCTLCGRSVSDYTIHMRRHLGHKPFKCDQCDQAFTRQSELKQHQRSHTGERPYLCTVCGRGFAKSGKLKCHLRIHTGERPYKCTYCEQAFMLAKDLKHHIRRHTGEKPHECGDCGKCFIQKTALRTHCKSQGHCYEKSINHEVPTNISILIS